MPKAEQDLDCTDDEWSSFIKHVEEMGEKEIEKMLARQKVGEPEPEPVAVTHPGMLYYWTHLMGGGDE
jgi:hypothetical protein